MTYFWTVYSLGLRLEEALNLHVGDIDAERMMVHIHRGRAASAIAQGPWRLSRTLPVQRGLSIEFLAEQGLFNLDEYWEILHQ